MRIGIDARFYGPIGAGGLGRYTKELVDALEEIDHENEYVIFLRRENWDDYIPKNSKFRKVLAPYKWYGWKEQIMMPIKIWHSKVDLMHFLHFNVPLFYFSSFVLTIHDLILIKFPSKKATTLSPLYFKFKYLIYKLVIHFALKKSKKIIVPSKYVKEDILRYFNIPDDKISVIYEGLTFVNKSNSFKDNKFVQSVDKKADKKFKMGYNIVDDNIKRKNANYYTNNDDVLSFLRNSNYILYIGNAYPHKNLEKLTDAFSLIYKKNSEEFKNLKLVLVGVKNYFYQQIIKYVLEKHSGIKDKIIFWGYATDKELEQLYKNAQIYVFPSLQEGFGLPPLEAMSYGVPVVSSNSSCLPEVLGEAAFYFDANDKEDIANKIIKVLNDKNLKEELIKKGHKRIKLYDWKDSAQKTLQIYLKFQR